MLYLIELALALGFIRQVYIHKEPSRLVTSRCSGNEPALLPLKLKPSLLVRYFDKRRLFS